MDFPDKNHRQDNANDRDGRSNPRSRLNTAHAFADRYKEDEPPMLPPERPSIRSSRTASSHVPSESSYREAPNNDFGNSRPNIHRTNTFEGPTQLHRDSSPIPIGRTSRVPSDSLTVRTQRRSCGPLCVCPVVTMSSMSRRMSPPCIVVQIGPMMNVRLLQQPRMVVHLQGLQATQRSTPLQLMARNKRHLLRHHERRNLHLHHRL